MTKQTQSAWRAFVQTAAVAAGTLAAADRTRAAKTSADVKIGLYSITYGGVWYRGDALTVEQVIGRARQVRLPGRGDRRQAPPRQSARYAQGPLPQLRKLAADQGIEIYAVAANNDFSSPIPEHREAQLVYLRELMRMTSDLGAKICASFWPGRASPCCPKAAAATISRKAVWKAEHQGFTDEQTWAWCRETLDGSRPVGRRFRRDAGPAEPSAGDQRLS